MESVVGTRSSATTYSIICAKAFVEKFVAVEDLISATIR